MKCPKTQSEVTADDCEECISERMCYEWCIDHIVFGSVGEPNFTHEMGKYGEGLGELLADKKHYIRKAKALAELIEANDFIMDISGLPAEDMVERVEERDPSFIEHIEGMEEPPKSAMDFWSGFGIWTITGLKAKYRDIWEKVIDAYFHSEAHKQLYEKYKLNGAVQSQIGQILEDSGFNKE